MADHQGSDTTSSWLWDACKANKMVRKYNPKTIMNHAQAGKETSTVMKVHMKLQVE